MEPELHWSRLPLGKRPLARAPGTAAPQLPLTTWAMPAGLTEPAGAASLSGVSASGTLTRAPAGALPVRVESTSVTLGAVTKAPVNACVESAGAQPVRSPVGTLVTKAAPVSALPKLSGGLGLPAPQIVAVKAPNTTTIQLPANFQLPPGMLITFSSVSLRPAGGDTGDVRAPDCTSLLVA